MAGTRSAEHILESAGNNFAPGMIEIDPQPLVFSTSTPTEGSPPLSKSLDELLFDNDGCDCGAGSSMLTSTGWCRLHSNMMARRIRRGPTFHDFFSSNVGLY